MTQPTLPGMGGKTGQFSDKVKRTKPLAMRTVQHDLHYDKPQWTGELHDPDFNERDTPRPGMTHAAIPGQLVMGAHDPREVGEVREHGNVLNPDFAGKEFRKYGPQFNARNSELWNQHGETRMLGASTPVESGQRHLRYDPSKDEHQQWGDQIRGPIRTDTQDYDPNHTDRNGAPKVFKLNDQLFSPDGHHRAFEARNRGMSQIPVHFLDFDANPKIHEQFDPDYGKPQLPSSATADSGEMRVHIRQEHRFPALDDDNAGQLHDMHGRLHEIEGSRRPNHVHEAAPVPLKRGIGSSPQFNRYGQELWPQSERHPGPPSSVIYRGRASAALNDDSGMYNGG